MQAHRKGWHQKDIPYPKAVIDPETKLPGSHRENTAMQREHPMICERCGGSGAYKEGPCKKCNGNGWYNIVIKTAMHKSPNVHSLTLEDFDGTNPG